LPLKGRENSAKDRGSREDLNPANKGRTGAKNLIHSRGALHLRRKEGEGAWRKKAGQGKATKEGGGREGFVHLEEMSFR